VVQSFEILSGGCKANVIWFLFKGTDGTSQFLSRDKLDTVFQVGFGFFLSIGSFFLRIKVSGLGAVVQRIGISVFIGLTSSTITVQICKTLTGYET